MSNMNDAAIMEQLFNRFDASIKTLYEFVASENMNQRQFMLDLVVAGRQAAIDGFAEASKTARSSNGLTDAAKSASRLNGV